MNLKITKDMTLNQILQADPATAEILASFKLDCSGCLAASTETLEQGAKMHGLNVDEIVTALNKIFTA